MRILVGADVPRDPNSGAAGTVYYTNLALRELGYQVDEIWADDLGRQIRHGNLHYLLELPYRYRKVVAQKCALADYDVIQLSQPHAYLAARDHQTRKRYGIFVNRSHGVESRVEEVVKQWRGRLNISNGRFPRSVLSTLLRRLIARHWPAVAKISDGIIVPCEDDRKYLLSRLKLDPERVRTIHHGVPQLFLDRETGNMTSYRMRKMLHVAQFSLFKGPHILGTVVSRVLSKHPDVTFSWVCSSLHHDEARSLFTPSVLDRVKMLDWMPQDKLISIYDNHGIFVFTSFAEGAAKASLEAMSRGLCVVSSGKGGMKDYILHAHNGFLVPGGDVAGFVYNIGRLLNIKAISTQIAKQARASAMRYNWRRCAEETINFYEHLLAKKS